MLDGDPSLYIKKKAKKKKVIKKGKYKNIIKYYIYIFLEKRR